MLLDKELATLISFFMRGQVEDGVTYRALMVSDHGFTHTCRKLAHKVRISWALGLVMLNQMHEHLSRVNCNLFTEEADAGDGIHQQSISAKLFKVPTEQNVQQFLGALRRPRLGDATSNVGLCVRKWDQQRSFGTNMMHRHLNHQHAHMI